MTFFRLSIRRVPRQPHRAIALRLRPGSERDPPRSLSVNFRDIDALHGLDSLHALPASFDRLQPALIGERDG
jgi:hypothetical protein